MTDSTAGRFFGAVELLGWVLLWVSRAAKALWQKWTNTPDPPPPHTTIYRAIAGFEDAFADSISWSFEYAGFDDAGRIVVHPEHRYVFLSGTEILCWEKNAILGLVNACRT